MSNMAYCRFQNTLKALDECKNELDDAGDQRKFFEELSTEERAALKSMFEVCREMVEEHEWLTN